MIAAHKTRFLYYSYGRYILIAAREDPTCKSSKQGSRIC